MARILIGEPFPEVSQLLVHVLSRLGHEPVLAPADGRAVPVPDVFLFEPDSAEQLERARALRSRAPELPLVVCSILPPTEATRALSPAAHVLKPFRRAELAAAVALASGDR